MSTSAAAFALRESFGDRRPPDITRKITACVACRKRKVKCHMTDSKPPCARCKTRGLPCSVNKSIQMILEDDATWKEAVNLRIGQIEQQLSSESALYHDSNASTLPPQSSDPIEVVDTEPISDDIEYINEASTPQHGTTSDTRLGVFPSSSLVETNLDDTPKATSSFELPKGLNAEPHIDNRALLNDPAAKQHFLKYQSHLDHHLCFVLPPSSTFLEVSSKSAFLAVAICAAAALSTGSSDYQMYKRALQTFVLTRNFAKQHSFDDVRALCISAFWIDDMAYPLTALAVRISCEMNLHRCITKMPHQKRECYERTRLYFLVYIIDHLVSISHGRPPMTRELKNIKDARMLLKCSFSAPNHSRGDLALISLVELWHINVKVFDSFGADLERDSGSFPDEMNSFDRSCDEWWADWKPVLLPLSHLMPTAPQISTPNPHYDLPYVYLTCAKLYLLSHAFRGKPHVNNEMTASRSSDDQLTNLKRAAVQCASKIVETCVTAAMGGSIFEILTPYLAMMTAFACRVLLRLGQTIPEGNAEDIGFTGVDVVQRLAAALQALDTVHASDLSGDESMSNPARKLISALTKLLSGNQASRRRGNHMENDTNTMHIHTPPAAFDNLLSNDFDFPSSLDFDWMDFNAVDLTSMND